MYAIDHRKTWMALSAIMFLVAGVASLVITDLVLLPVAHSSERSILDNMWFSSMQSVLFSCLFFPMLFAALSTYRWLWKSGKIFSSWINVAMASWLSLLINPLMWFVALSSFFLFWLVSFCVFFTVGVAMSIAWRVSNAK